MLMSLLEHVIFAFWQLLLKVMSEKFELVIEKMFSNQLLNIIHKIFISLTDSLRASGKWLKTLAIITLGSCAVICKVALFT
jgi:hypothetical protein